MTTFTWALADPPSSSVTVTVMLRGPSAVTGYAWDAVHVPTPADSVTVPATGGLPSPKVTVQVWVSFVPGSVNGAVTGTGVLASNSWPGVGLVMLTAGATLATVTVVESLATPPEPSFAVRVAM